MRAVIHEFHCLLPGYEALKIAINVRLTQPQLDAMRRQKRPATAIVDFPNWETVAAAVGLVALNPETGDETDEPLAKPPFPLTWDGLAAFPSDLMHYLIGNQALSDGLQSYLEDVHPNLSGR